MTPTLKAACYTLAVAGAETWLSCTIRRRPAYAERSLGHKYMVEASQWATIASSEKNPVLSLMHANYALCCAGLAKTLSGKSDLRREFGVDVDGFVSRVTRVQQAAVRSLGKSCPAVRPDAEAAKASGWV